MSQNEESWLAYRSLARNLKVAEYSSVFEVRLLFIHLEFLIRIVVPTTET
jgi:hypothetical protein